MTKVHLKDGLFEVKVIKDSIPDHLPIDADISKVRLVTLQLKYPRFIHGQFLTHRQFSRNSSSSRAIPITRMIKEIEENPVFPLEWGSNKPGMQAGQEVDDKTKRLAIETWESAMKAAVEHAKLLNELGIHKQVVNRILEPYQLMHTLVTATDYNNFLDLRIDDAAQPEIQKLAILINKALHMSIPERCEYHIPFVTTKELETYGVRESMMISAARCARVSYLNHDGSEPDVEKDLKLAKHLKEAFHMSPFEHQATDAYMPHSRFFNLQGWKSQRYQLESNRA